MLRVWKWYQNCLVKHPIKTQMISSGVLWGLGEIGAQSTFSSMARKTLQSSENDEKFKIDWRRVRRTSLFGFAVVGPAGHFWYKGLDLFLKWKMVRQPNSLRFVASGMQQNYLRFVASKVALDGVIFGPINPLLAILSLHSPFNLSMALLTKRVFLKLRKFRREEMQVVDISMLWPWKVAYGLSFWWLTFDMYL